MRRLLAPVAAAAVLALAAGCASTGAPSDQSDERHSAVIAKGQEAPKAAPKVDVWQNTVDFVSAATAASYDKARHLAAPGSAAARYVEHWEAYDRALLTHGEEYETAGEIVPNEQRETVLYVPPTDGPTTTFHDFVTDERGRMVDFATNDDGIVSDRLWSDSDSVKVHGVKVSVVSAYKHGGDNVMVVLRMDAGRVPVEPSFSATYMNPDGLQIDAGQYTSTPSRLQPGATGYLVYHFPQSQIGGDLEFEFWPGNAHGLAKLHIS